MENVQIDVPCACGCKAVTKIRVNTWTGAWEILKPARSREERNAIFGQRIAVLEHYKQLKGITKDNMPTWDKHYRARAFRSIDKLLGLFSALPDAVGVAKECLTETYQRAQKESWGWDLEKVANIRAPEWLLDKQKEAVKRR